MCFTNIGNSCTIAGNSNTGAASRGTGAASRGTGAINATQSLSSSSCSFTSSHPSTYSSILSRPRSFNFAQSSSSKESQVKRSSCKLVPTASTGAIPKVHKDIREEEGWKLVQSKKRSRTMTNNTNDISVSKPSKSQVSSTYRFFLQGRCQFCVDGRRFSDNHPLCVGSLLPMIIWDAI